MLDVDYQTKTIDTVSGFEEQTNTDSSAGRFDDSAEIIMEGYKTINQRIERQRELYKSLNKHFFDNKSSNYSLKIWSVKKA